MEENHSAFGVFGAMQFSVIKHIFTFVHTLNLLRSLFVGFVELELCLSNNLMIGCPSNLSWGRELEVY